MASKKKNETGATLPQTVEDMDSQSSSITYANEVIAIIAGLAASEVEGIAGMCNVSGNLMGKNRNITRGVKVEVGSEEVGVDLFINVEYGTPIQRAAHDAQEGVKKAIESMTGLHCVRIDVHVLGVSFEKEMMALQAGAGKAVLGPGEAEASIAKTKKNEKQKEESKASDAEQAAAEDLPDSKTETKPEAEDMSAEETGEIPSETAIEE